MPAKTADCGGAEARNYLTKARSFLQAAHMFVGESFDVAASNAVHAAISAGVESLDTKAGIVFGVLRCSRRACGS